MNVGSRRRRGAPSRHTLIEIRDVIARETSGYRPGGLRVNWDRLSEDEQRKVVELVRAAGRDGGWSFSNLSKRDRAVLEGLIEKAADANGIFENARSMEEIRALAAEAHQASVRRPFSRREQATLFEALGDALVAGSMSATTLGTFVIIVLALERGEGFAPHSWVERDPVDGESVLVVSKSFGLLRERQDWRASLAAWQKGCEQLARNSWLELDGSAGNEIRLRLGSRAKRALRGEPPRKARAA